MCRQHQVTTTTPQKLILYHQMSSSRAYANMNTGNTVFPLFHLKKFYKLIFTVQSWQHTKMKNLGLVVVAYDIM